MKRSMLSAAILGILGFGATFSALAINLPVHLCAREFQKDLTPDDASDNATSMVTMWGYSRGVSAATACNSPIATVTSPGPRINVPDPAFITGVTVTLHNRLPRPTSLVIPGAVKGMTPQFFTPADDPATPADESLLPRVRSFDVEAAPGGSQTYVWNNLAPGSYMYHSGTHPQVQVQMGLYGAIVDNVTTAFPSAGMPGVAYPGVSYTHDIVLFYTEIDRAIHNAVADGGYDGMETGGQIAASTIGYAPKYFEVDVNPGPGITVDGTTGDITIPSGATPLVRFFNVGHRSHVPTLLSGGFDVHAEDAKQYPAVREQYSILLPPLKTKDAIMDLGAGAPGGTVRLTDSAMALSSPDAATSGFAIPLAAGDEIANGDGNGMAVNFSVAATSGYTSVAPSADAPIARRDRMTVSEGETIDNILAQALSNDSNASLAGVNILSYPGQGELITDGSSYRYEHGGGEGDRDSFIYEVANAAGERSRAGVVIDVMPINDAPVANDDTVSAQVGQLLEIRALANDEDVDSSSVRITAVDASGLGSLTANDQVIVFEASTEGSEDVVYSIADSSGATASAVLHLTVAKAASAAAAGTYTSGSSSSGSGAAARTSAAPEAGADAYSVAQGGVLDTTSSVILGVLSNDTIGAVVNTKLVEYPVHGAIKMNEDGTFVYEHDNSATTSDDFSYEVYNDGGVARAKVTITVTP